ncbi:MAG: 50S ribosomal protein L23 [Candidatus Omnitrophica bacterium]|jgi:large subunit ribosomal protein L23|nr:50S ribosomal protein L23 [Candidatus Omnitrophota bacterium]
MSQVKSIYSVIRSPLVTEKSTRNSVFRQYAFQVAKDSNKIEIKNAVEKIYNVKVEKVRSAIVKGKMKKIRGNQAGKTTSWKKAIVTLKEGFDIKLA